MTKQDEITALDEQIEQALAPLKNMLTSRDEGIYSSIHSENTTEQLQ